MEPSRELIVSELNEIYRGPAWHGPAVLEALDGVSDVVGLTADQMRPAPDFSSSFDTQYITGLGTVEERMLILVDIEKLMSGADMALMEEATLQ